jgi:rsbT antagonist protein RsbS
MDVSGLRVMDDSDFKNLRKIIDSAKIMGYPTVLSGFKPGVVASLVSLNVNVDGVIAARNMDDAFLLLVKPKRTTEIEDNEEDMEVNEEDMKIKIDENGENFG